MLINNFSVTALRHEYNYNITFIISVSAWKGFKAFTTDVLLPMRDQMDGAHRALSIGIYRFWASTLEYRR